MVLEQVDGVNRFWNFYFEGGEPGNLITLHLSSEFLMMKLRPSLFT
jgi:hypothetical protein